MKLGVIRHCEGTDNACDYQQEVQSCVDTRLQKHRPNQHVEVDGSLWHNNIVFGDGEIMDPGGGRELAQRDLSYLLPFMALPLLSHHLIPITCNIYCIQYLTVWGVQPVIIPQTSWLESTDLYTRALRVMQEHACPHPHHVCSSDISICSGLQGAQNSRNNSMIAHIGAESSRRRCAQTVLQGEGCTDCWNPYSHSIT